jgi:hypothetical protein
MNYALRKPRVIATGLTGSPLVLLATLLGINSENLMNFINELLNLIKELLIFLRTQKKLWLAPIIIVIVILGALLVAAQGSVIAPFIYTLF